MVCDLGVPDTVVQMPADGKVHHWPISWSLSDLFAYPPLSWPLL